MNISNSLKDELISHIIDTIENQNLTTFDELHHLAFNEDYYIIGYFQASEWLKRHDIDAFEAIAAVLEWEESNLGEITIKASDINSETIVNKLVYSLGEDVLSEFDLDADKDELIESLKNWQTVS